MFFILVLKICASPYPAANKYQASAWSPKQTQEFELYPQASPLAEWLCVPSGKRMNVGSNPAVGVGFFPARKTGVCYGYRAGVLNHHRIVFHQQAPMIFALNKYQDKVWAFYMFDLQAPRDKQTELLNGLVNG